MLYPTHLAYKVMHQWSLQVDGTDLFRTGGTSSHSEDGYFHTDFDQCFLRIEYQTLCALPTSKAIVFCVRSYLTPLRQIREEGNGVALAKAIEGMPEQLGVYKMRPLWGEKILPWLKNPIA
jgi:hypothetical protein